MIDRPIGTFLLFAMLCCVVAGLLCAAGIVFGLDPAGRVGQAIFIAMVVAGANMLGATITMLWSEWRGNK